MRGNFCSNPADMLRYDAAVSLAVIPPQLLVDSLLVKHLTGVLGQQLHNVKFLFRQEDFFLPTKQLALGKIYRKISDKS